MVGIIVRDLSADAVWGHHNHRDPRAIAKEIERLNVPGIVVAAAFINRDEDGCAGPQFRIAFYRVDNLLRKALEKIELGRSRMSVHPSTRLHVGDASQSPIL